MLDGESGRESGTRSLQDLILLLNEHKGFESHIMEIMEELCLQTGAERAHFFQVSEDEQTYREIYEWCGKDIRSTMVEKLEFPLRELEEWDAYLEARNCYVLRDIEKIRLTNPMLYLTFKRHQVSSAATLPMYISGHLYAMLALDNPAFFTESFGKALFTLGCFIVGVRYREDQEYILETKNRELREAWNQEHELHSLYEMAVESTGMMLFQYDPQCREITMMDNPSTIRLRMQYGLPKIIRNVPEMMLPVIAVPSREDFLRAFLQIDRGANDSTALVEFKVDASHKTGSIYSLRLSMMFNPSTCTTGVFGILRNISKIWDIASSFRQEQDRYHSVPTDFLIARWHVNLTENRFISISFMDGRNVEFILEHPYEQSAAFFLGNAVWESERAKIRQITDRVWLQEAYNRGEHQFGQEYDRIVKRGVRRKYCIDVHTCLSPESGDLEAFFYLSDLTRRNLEKTMIQRLSSFGVDFIGLIDPSSGTYIIYSEIEGLTEGENPPDLDYRKRNLSALGEKTADEDAQELYDKTEISVVLASLDRNGAYSVFYSSESEGKKRRKMIQYCYLSDRDKTILFARSDITEQMENEEKQRRQLYEARSIAEHDVLTGILNRRGGEKRLFQIREMVRCGRASCGLVLFDIDDFKKVNDLLGHNAGDRALKMIVSTVARVIRDRDSFIRWGGDEFLIILTAFCMEDAQVFSTRVYTAMKGLAVEEGEKAAALSISMGITLFSTKDASFQETVERADRALYLAKKENKGGMYVLWPEE